MRKQLPLVFLFALPLIITCCKSPQTKKFLSSQTVVIPENEISNEKNFSADSLQLLFSEQSKQTFIVSLQKKSLITGKKGLKIYVDPDALETGAGLSPKVDISVTIMELNNPEDFLRANAATVSDGRLLASGGSYYVEMRSAGEKLRLKNKRTLTVEFPVLRDNEMELFYGERNSENNMNWKRTGIALKTSAEKPVEFFDSPYSPVYYTSYMLDTSGHPKVFRTLHDKVYFYNKPVTILALLDSVNKNGIKLALDTVHPWPKLKEPLLPGQYRDTPFMIANYGPESQYMIRSFAEEARIKKLKDEQAEKQRSADSLRNIRIRENKQNSLAGKILKYYNPSNITELGWINCDRFYKEDNQCETEMELPIAFNSSSVKYFILFPTINSMITETAVTNEKGSLVLAKLPKGMQASFIGFIRNKGKIYTCRKNFLIGNRTETVFEEISAEELKRIFGMNIKS